MMIFYGLTSNNENVPHIWIFSLLYGIHYVHKFFIRVDTAFSFQFFSFVLSLRFPFMANISFTSYCGLCYCRIAPSKGGWVYSCGDFLCSLCVPDGNRDQNCAVCGKTNVNSLRLNADMPEDVLDKMNDLSNEFETLQEALSFQIRHYKRVLSSLSLVLQDRDKNINDLNRYSNHYHLRNN